MGTPTGSSRRGRATRAHFPCHFPRTVGECVCRAKRTGVFAGRLYKAEEEEEGPLACLPTAERARYTFEKKTACAL